MTRGNEKSQNKKDQKRLKSRLNSLSSSRPWVSLCFCDCECVCAVNVYNKSARLVTHLAHEQQQANAVRDFLLV